MMRCTSKFITISTLLKWCNFAAIEYAKPALVHYPIQLIVRHAGHSHWQNIKHTKEANDRRKCQQFQFFIKLIHKALAGGASTDPKINTKLRNVINDAKKINMPTDTINRVIQNYDIRRKNPIHVDLLYRSTNGVYLFLKITTDDKNRTTGEINRIAKKRKFIKQDKDGAAVFYIKSYVLAKPPPDIEDVADKSLEDAIEVGAEEVTFDEIRPDLLKFICEPSELNKVKSKLKTRNYTIELADEDYIPKIPKEISEEEMNTINELIQELEGNVLEVEKIVVNVV